MLAEKHAALLERLESLGSVLVAYSGGVDSTLLAVCAHAALGERCKAVLATSDTYPQSEVVGARDLAAELGLTLLEVETYELADPRFAENTPERCYWCKGELFGLLARVAEVHGLAYVADGNNADDLSDHRPGHRAAVELGVVSPLQDVGMTKAEIRQLARELGLPNWDKPSAACLASRVPYGTPITVELLARIEQAEARLRQLGIRQLRVRHHGPLARIEVEPGDFDLLMSHRDAVVQHLRALGYTYVTLDLAGFRSGSLNQGLPGTDRA